MDFGVCVCALAVIDMAHQSDGKQNAMFSHISY